MKRSNGSATLRIDPTGALGPGRSCIGKQLCESILVVIVRYFFIIFLPAVYCWCCSSTGPGTEMSRSQRWFHFVFASEFERHVAVCGNFVTADDAIIACGNIQGVLSNRYANFDMRDALAVCSTHQTAWVGSTLSIQENQYMGRFEGGVVFNVLRDDATSAAVAGTNLIVKIFSEIYADYSSAPPSGPPRAAMCWSANTPCPEQSSCNTKGTQRVGYMYPNCCACWASARGPSCQCAVGNDASDCSAIGADYNNYTASGTCECHCKQNYFGRLCRSFCALDSVHGGTCKAASTREVGYDSVTSQCVCDCNPWSAGPQCQCTMASLNGQCLDRGATRAVWNNNACGCECIGQNHVGDSCQCTLLSNGGMCHDAGTVLPTVDASTQQCGCECKASYTGSNCEYRSCTPEEDCITAHTVGATGFGPNPDFNFTGNCTCDCREQYVGAQCETEICHANHHCRGQGIGIVGTFPNCICTCRASQFGGRNCRTLTTTLSLTQTMNRTISLAIPSTLTPSEPPTVTPSAGRSLTVSTTVTPSGSRSDSGTKSASPSPTRRSTTVSLSPSGASTMSGSRNPTTSNSPSRGSRSRTHSYSSTATSTHFVSASISSTATCRGYDNLDVNNTCEVFRPLPAASTELLRVYVEAKEEELKSKNDNNNNHHMTNSDDTSSSPSPPSSGGGTASSGVPNTAAASPRSIDNKLRVDASWLVAPDPNQRCMSIHVPFSSWQGRRGAAHWLAVASIDARIMLQGSPKTPGVLAGDGGGGAEQLAAITVTHSTMEVVPITVDFILNRLLAANVTRGVGSVLPVLGTPEEAAQYSHATEDDKDANADASEPPSVPSAVPEDVMMALRPVVSEPLVIFKQRCCGLSIVDRQRSIR